MPADHREWFPIGEAALHVGVSVDTLRRWEREGHVRPTRTDGNQRRYHLTDLERLISDPPYARQTTPAGDAA